MAGILAQPQAMALAAGDLAGIGAAIQRARATAAAPITTAAAPGADAVAAAATRLFNTFGLDYQALGARAEAFHAEFTQALAAGGQAYSAAEAANATMTRATVTRAAQSVTLIMGGTGNPMPGPTYTATVFNDYVATSFTGISSSDAQALFTPESLFPFTGLATLPLNQSISQGVSLLNSDILQQISGGNTVVVVGYSQSAVIASLEMRALTATPNPPSPGQLSFVLLGDPMNPNGGMMTRFPGMHLSSIGLYSYGVTPTTTTYPTHIYTTEYDGFADFPRYPIDLLADWNAIAGIPHAHGQYASLSTGQVGNAVTLPTDPAYGTATTYSMIPITNLPLLDPLRSVPLIGTPLADLLQPDLTYLVNWGYGDPAYGYSTGPANVPTPFGLFPPRSDTTALAGDLVTGTQQGISAFVSDVGATRLPSWSQIAAVLASTPAPTWHQPTGLGPVVHAVTDTIATGSTTLLRTADIAGGLLVAVPSYDAGLFLDGIAEAGNGHPLGLINAVGDPLAVDLALGVITGGAEGLVLFDAAQSIATDFAALL